jgi:hypothetical protein
MTDSADDQQARSPDWDVSICYRQVDGSEVADWLQARLQGRPFPAAGEPQPRIRFYVDRYGVCRGLIRVSARDSRRGLPRSYLLTQRGDQSSTCARYSTSKDCL